MTPLPPRHPHAFPQAQVLQMTLASPPCCSWRLVPRAAVGGLETTPPRTPRACRFPGRAQVSFLLCAWTRGTSRTPPLKWHLGTYTKVL